MDEQAICRICGTQCGAVRIPLCEENSVILSDINFVLRSHVEEISIDDSLTKWVCQQCLETLSSVVGFIRRAIETHRILMNASLPKDVQEVQWPSDDQPNVAMEYEEIKIEDEQFVDHNNTRITDEINGEEHQEQNDEDEDYFVPIENVQASYDDNDAVEVSSDDYQDDHLQLVTVPKKTYLKCYTCNLHFSRENELLRHLKKEKHATLAFCHLCKSKFTLQRLLRYHLKRRHGVYSCPTCDQMFHSEAELTTHCENHEEPRPFDCRLCNKQFVRKTSYNLHISKQHRNISVACDICDDPFLSMEEMMSHRSVHRKCPICSEVQKTESSFNRHIIEKHSNESHSCTQCQVVFETKEELTEHMQSHGELSFADDVIKIEDDSE